MNTTYEGLQNTFKGVLTFLAFAIVVIPSMALLLCLMNISMKGNPKEKEMLALVCENCFSDYQIAKDVFSCSKDEK